MTCPYCGTQMCQCINQSQMQMANQQAAYQNIHLAAQQARFQQQFPNYKEPTPEEKFMDFIDGKSDDEIVIAFEILEHERRENQHRILEEMEKSFALDDKKNRDNFMAMCKRFRPSINEDFIKRICNLKAFW